MKKKMILAGCILSAALLFGGCAAEDTKTDSGAASTESVTSTPKTDEKKTDTKTEEKKTATKTEEKKTTTTPAATTAPAKAAASGTTSTPAANTSSSTTSPTTAPAAAATTAPAAAAAGGTSQTATPSSGGSAAAHTHSYSVTTNATCSSAGVKTCSCGATQTIPATGNHNYSIPVTGTVHHDAVYQNVLVVDQAAWDEPIYQDQPIYDTVGVAICSACGAEFYDTGVVDHLFDAHDGAASYRVETRKTQIGSQQVQIGTQHHDEISHYEQQLVQNAWDETVTTGYKCSVCGSVR